MSTDFFENEEHRHRLLLFAGLALLLAGTVIFHFASSQGQWPVAKAEVLSVEVQCRMQAIESGRSYRSRPSSVVVGCDQVDRFLSDNADTRWTWAREYSGQVRVTRDGAAVTVVRGIGRNGQVPRIGDVFEVLQNPAEPTQLSSAERSLAGIVVSACLGGFGVFILALAFFLV